MIRARVHQPVDQWRRLYLQLYVQPEPAVPATPLVGARDRGIVGYRCWGGLGPKLKAWGYLMWSAHPASQFGAWFLQQWPGFWHEAQPTHGRKCSAAIFLIVWFALELFNFNNQEIVKSGEKRDADNVLGARIVFMYVIAVGGLSFHSRSMVFSLDEAEMMTADVLLISDTPCLIK